MSPALASEDLLCLLLARPRVAPENRERVAALLQGNLEWDTVVKRATEHEVYPLVWRNLQSFDLSAAPEPVRHHLSGLFKMNAHRSLLLADELAAVLGLLRQAEIPAIPLKGPCLAEALYGSAAYRVCSDIDVLVPRGHLVRALELLAKERSYESEYAPSFVTDRVMRNTYEYPLHRATREGSCLLEIHCGLLWECSAESGSDRQVWQNARVFEFRSVPCLFLSPEWEFLFLVVHAARHNWQGLKWLVDIDEICAAERVDWRALHEKAAELGWIWLIEQTLGICHSLFGTRAPEGFTPLPVPEKLKLYPAAPSTPTPIENTLLCVKLAQQPLQKIRLLFRRIFVPTPRDGALCRLPGGLNFLYYLVRPLRLGYQGWARGCAKVWKRPAALVSQNLPATSPSPTRGPTREIPDAPEHRLRP